MRDDQQPSDGDGGRPPLLLSSYSMMASQTKKLSSLMGPAVIPSGAFKDSSALVGQLFAPPSPTPQTPTSIFGHQPLNGRQAAAAACMIHAHR